MNLRSIPRRLFSLTCSDSTLPTNQENLVSKAALAFAKESGNPINFHIHLEKRIPHGAGLGGGSSNAAATLLALNDLLEKPVSSAKLHEIAANIGCDVPFFLNEGAARCTGRGEIIEPVESPPSLPIILLKPDFSVPTPDAYRNCLEAEKIAGIEYGPQDYEGLSLVNDLEKPVFAKHRYLAELKHWLLNNHHTKAVLMSGSGSTMFAILHPKAKPERLTGAIRRHFDENLWIWSGTL